MQFFNNHTFFVAGINKVKTFWITYNIIGHWRSTEVNDWAELVKMFVIIMNNWAPHDMSL